MKHITHKLFGISLGLLAANFLSISPFYFILSLFTSTIPDIDTPHSKIGRWFPGITNWVNNKYHHRGITHSFLGLVIFMFIFYFLLLKLFYTGFIFMETVYYCLILMTTGYISHLLIDFLTPSGLPLFYPGEKRYAVGLVTTGSLEEEYIAGFLIIVITAKWVLL